MGHHTYYLVVSEENGLQLAAGGEGGGDVVQLVDGKADLPQVGQLAHLLRQAGQPVVAQLQILQQIDPDMDICNTGGGLYVMFQKGKNVPVPVPVPISNKTGLPVLRSSH